MKEDKIIYIEECDLCPMCDMNDMSAGFSCRLMPIGENFIKENKRFKPETPEWCPLKKNNITLKFGKDGLNKSR